MEPIKIKTHTSVSHKIPTVQYGNVEVMSSLTLEVPSDATNKDVDKAIADGKDHLKRIFEEVVKPDTENKKALYIKGSGADGTPDEILVRSKILYVFAQGDRGKILEIIQNVQATDKFTEAERERIIKLGTKLYNELKEE